MPNALFHRYRIFAACCLALLSGFASADDVKDLEEELALTIEDATPGQPGSIELNGGLRYQRLRASEANSGRNEYQLTPRLQIGVARNFQVAIAAPYRLGNAPDTSRGELRLDALLRLNDEGRYLPAFAVDVGLERPYGAGDAGTEILVKGIATKSLGVAKERDRPAQLHVNLVARRNLNPGEDERRNRYLFGAALSKKLSERWLVAGSLFREEQRERGSAFNIAEAGARWKLSEKTILSGSVGAGLNREAPLWRLLLGFQRSLD
ncbi:hypothetical protein [Noviherbaspirillum humi]|nr:hypothetical protein [Noviherbaspirillum humi]